MLVLRNACLSRCVTIIVMDSSDPQSKNPLVERFLTLLKRNLLKDDMDQRVLEIRRRAKRKKLKDDLVKRMN